MGVIKDLLSKSQSKTIRDEIVNKVYSDPKLISELMGCFFSDNLRLNQYAAWPVGIIGVQKPQLILPYLGDMVNGLDLPVHDAFIRNTLRVLQFIDLPEDIEGVVYDKSFSYLNDPDRPIAIRVFAMSVLTNIAVKYPDLKDELIKTIELYYPFGSAGFKSRARREIKRLKK